VAGAGVDYLCLSHTPSEASGFLAREAGMLS
jgi:hypothetical protein